MSDYVPNDNYVASSSNTDEASLVTPHSSSGNSVEQWRHLPFSIDYLSNQAWHPGPLSESYMSLEAYNEAEFEFYEAARKVVFNGIYVETDSCDCGDGYGCSHGSYPVGFKIESYPFLYTEWDGDYIHVDNNGDSFNFQIKDLTLGKFYDALHLIGVAVELNS